MPALPRFDHVGITVADLEAVSTFFLRLGLEREGPSQIVEGEFLDTVIGMEGARVEVVMLRTADGATKLELSQFLAPPHQPSPPDEPANRLGLRNVCFEVDDVRATANRLREDGFELVGGVGEYEGVYLMCYVRGPEGIIVSLAQSPT